MEQTLGSAHTQEVYGPLGNRMGFLSGQTFQKGRVPLVAGAWARYGLNGLSFYRHPDWQGSSRLASTPTRTVYYDGAYAPYGESYAEMGTTDHVFTGQYQDTEPDLYDFPFREYHPTQGRWLSPDPVGGDITNPQSLNRYAYTLNSPTNLIDPLGLQPDDDYGDCDPWSDPQCPEPCDPSLDVLCQPPPCDVLFGPGCNGPGPAGGSPDWGTAGSTTGGSPPGDVESLFGNGCIQPSIFDSVFIFGGTLLAKGLSHLGNGQTRSVSLGAGGSAGVGIGPGVSGSVLVVNTVDSNGNAAASITGQFQVGAQVGSSAIAGIQAGISNDPVPTTPQASWGINSNANTTTLAGVYQGLGVNLDLPKVGGGTVTVGVGSGIARVSARVDWPSVVVLAGVATVSIPYCGGKVW